MCGDSTTREKTDEDSRSVATDSSFMSYIGDKN